MTVVHRSQALNDHMRTNSDRTPGRGGTNRNGAMYRTLGLHSANSSRASTPGKDLKGRRGSAASGRSSAQGKQRRRPGSNMSLQRSNSASSAKAVAAAFGNTNHHSSSYGPQQKTRLVNVCYIDKPRPAHNQSLNYINRKNEQAKQLEENLQMLKKIHGAEASVKAVELRRHEQQVKRLKKMVSDGGHR